MKCSESWLREWVNPSVTREELCDSLTMAGFEVDEVLPVAGDFRDVVVGKILQAVPHPESEQLSICEVTIGSTSLSIVCAASNAKAGLKTAVAVVGSRLSNQIEISSTTIRGVTSDGMLCSALELGLFDDNNGILELPFNAPIGEDLRKYLALDDYALLLAITPNRGDCLSIRGMSREIAALYNIPLKTIKISETLPTLSLQLPVIIHDTKHCPRYVGRVIKDLRADVQSPIWLKEKLRRASIRSINPIVDVTNYVMLELGQPMHAFDFDKIAHAIHVRRSNKGEQITLLDGNEVELDDETLVIADKNNALAIAGVMGGILSSVTPDTTSIFLESAYFSAQTIASQRQFYNVTSESSFRFERGVDAYIQREAIERATQLILEIAGGNAGPITEQVTSEYLPQPKIIEVSKNSISRILGVEIPEADIISVFERLMIPFEKKAGGYQLSIPSYRYDIALAEDVIEEIARLYGYDRIPTHHIEARLSADPLPHNSAINQDWMQLRQALCNVGYHEIVSYSFVDKKLQALLDPLEIPHELFNPISQDMAVMRTNLWPGLLNTLLYNKSRQQNRVRLFEIGTCFLMRDGKVYENTKLGGILMGSAHHEQWGVQVRGVDFYDMKGDLETILGFYFSKDDIRIEPATDPALHPGQTGMIYIKNQMCGLLGALHPIAKQHIDLTENIFVFSLDLPILKDSKQGSYQEISKFPEIRRDLAILLDQSIPSKAIQYTIKELAGDWLKDVFIFDVYQGKGILPGLKSIAVALMIQHPHRTLKDEEVAALMERVIKGINQQLGAQLRS